MDNGPIRQRSDEHYFNLGQLCYETKKRKFVKFDNNFWTTIHYEDGIHQRTDSHETNQHKRVVQQYYDTKEKTTKSVQHLIQSVINNKKHFIESITAEITAKKYINQTHSDTNLHHWTGRYYKDKNYKGKDDSKYKNNRQLIIKMAGTDKEIDAEKPKMGKSPHNSHKENYDKINIEDSRLPGVKILLRGDFLGALNCLFPQLNLIPSGTVYCAEQFEKLVVSHHDLITETNSKVPILDPNFSLFSESNTKLEKIFELAKKYRIEMQNQKLKTASETFELNKKQFSHNLEGYIRDEISKKVVNSDYTDTAKKEMKLLHPLFSKMGGHIGKAHLATDLETSWRENSKINSIRNGNEIIKLDGPPPITFDGTKKTDSELKHHLKTDMKIYHDDHGRKSPEGHRTVNSNEPDGSNLKSGLNPQGSGVSSVYPFSGKSVGPSVHFKQKVNFENPANGKEQSETVLQTGHINEKRDAEMQNNLVEVKTNMCGLQRKPFSTNTATKSMIRSNANIESSQFNGNSNSYQDGQAEQFSDYHSDNILPDALKISKSEPRVCYTEGNQTFIRSFHNTMGNYLEFNNNGGGHMNVSLDKFMKDKKPATSTPMTKKKAILPNDLDETYLNYITNFLLDNYPDRCHEFKDIECMVHQLEKSYDDKLIKKKIAPFNSNLPVLNISECGKTVSEIKKDSHTVSPKKKRLYSSVLKCSPRKNEAKKMTSPKKSCKFLSGYKGDEENTKKTSRKEDLNKIRHFTYRGCDTEYKSDYNREEDIEDITDNLCNIPEFTPSNPEYRNSNGLSTINNSGLALYHPFNEDEIIYNDMEDSIVKNINNLLEDNIGNDCDSSNYLDTNGNYCNMMNTKTVHGSQKISVSGNKAVQSIGNICPFYAYVPHKQIIQQNFNDLVCKNHAFLSKNNKPNINSNPFVPKSGFNAPSQQGVYPISQMNQNNFFINYNDLVLKSNTIGINSNNVQAYGNSEQIANFKASNVNNFQQYINKHQASTNISYTSGIFERNFKDLIDKYPQNMQSKNLPAVESNTEEYQTTFSFIQKKNEISPLTVVNDLLSGSVTPIGNPLDIAVNSKQNYAMCTNVKATNLPPFLKPRDGPWNAVHNAAFVPHSNSTALSRVQVQETTKTGATIAQPNQTLLATAKADSNLVFNQFISMNNLSNGCDFMYQNRNFNITAKNAYEISAVQQQCGIANASSNVSAAAALSFVNAATAAAVAVNNKSINNLGMVQQCCYTNISEMRTIISVSDLEKQALEQYHSSEEIQEKFDVLEKEAEEQYGN